MIKKWIFIGSILPLFSGCFFDWTFRSEVYTSELQEIYTAVNTTSAMLSTAVNTSSLQSSEALQTQEMQTLLQALQSEKQKAENLPLFRGDESYKKAMIAWIDSLLIFFQKDMIAFLSSPQTASSSDELQGSMQMLYESTKKIKETKKIVEEKIESLKE